MMAQRTLVEGIHHGPRMLTLANPRKRKRNPQRKKKSLRRRQSSGKDQTSRLSRSVSQHNKLPKMLDERLKRKRKHE